MRDTPVAGRQAERQRGRDTPVARRQAERQRGRQTKRHMKTDSLRDTDNDRLTKSQT